MTLPYGSFDSVALLDYYAAHAPLEIPDWYYCENVPGNPEPVSLHTLTDEERALVAAWVKDPCYDLTDINSSPGLRKVEQDYKQYWDDLHAWKLRNTWHRIASWRFDYAEQMIQELNRRFEKDQEGRAG